MTTYSSATSQKKRLFAIALACSSSLFFGSVIGCVGSIGEDQASPDPSALDAAFDDTATAPTDAKSATSDAGRDGAIGDGSLASDSGKLVDDSGKTPTDTAIAPSDGGTDAAKPDTFVPPPDAVAVEDTFVGPSSTRQVEKRLGATDAPNGFYEYLPPGYKPTGTGSPLLVFWHGLGEDGNGTTELSKVLVNGPPKLIANDTWPSSRPFVVLSPQNGSGCPSGSSIKAFITWSLAHYNIDPKRIYLTGLSCGAIGSWGYLQSEALTTPIAAAVLIAGTGNGAWDTHKCALGRIAIWGFAGDADGTVDPSGTIYPMTNLIACPAPPRRDAQMTIYPGVGHDSWTHTYDGSAGHDVFAWLLTNHL